MRLAIHYTKLSFSHPRDNAFKSLDGSYFCIKIFSRFSFSTF